MRTQRLTPTERLIYNSISQSATPVNAAHILNETCASIHTLVPAFAKLKKLGHIVQVDLGDGPRYSIPDSPIPAREVL